MTVLGLFGPIGLPELLIILLILVLIFGGRKIPELARGLGEGIRNFRAGVRDERGEDDHNKGETSGGA